MKSKRYQAGVYPACQKCRAAVFCIRRELGGRACQIGIHALRAGERFRPFSSSSMSLLVVCDGSVKTCLPGSGTGSRQQVTGFNLPGEIISFEAMINPVTRHDVVALEATTVREITCASDPVANMAVWRDLLGLLRADSSHRRARLRPFAGRQNATQRLTVWLGNLADRCRLRGFDPQAVAFRMTRAEIGNYLGLAKETVCRLFVQFQREGLIQQRGRRFLIRRPDAFVS
jgi:CRP/FNR family transcriptional regulator